MNSLNLFESVQQISFCRVDTFLDLFIDIYNKLSSLSNILGIGFRIQKVPEREMIKRLVGIKLNNIPKPFFGNFSIIIYGDEFFTPETATTYNLIPWYSPGIVGSKRKSIINFFSRVSMSEFYTRCHKTSIKNISYFEGIKHSHLTGDWSSKNKKFMGLIHYKGVHRLDDPSIPVATDNAKSQCDIQANPYFNSVGIFEDKFCGLPITLSAVNLLSYSTSPKNYNYE